MTLEDTIKKAKKSLVIGSTAVIKGIRTGNMSKVFLSRNCPDEIASEIKHLNELSKFELTETKESNEELGILCRKQFKISVLGIKKDGN
jgi:ribosomal protein L30E